MSEKIKLTESMKDMLLFCMSQMSDLSDADFKQHGFRRSTYDRANAWLSEAIASLEAQLLTARNDALNEAANVCLKPVDYGGGMLYYMNYEECRKAILALKG